MIINRKQKRIVLIILDFILLCLSQLISYFFIENYISQTKLLSFGFSIVTFMIYLLLASYLKVFSVINRYTDYKTLTRISISLVVSYFIVFLFKLILKFNISDRFLILSCLFSILFTILARLGWRLIYELRQKSKETESSETKRILVVGAGDGGNLFIKTAQSDFPEFNIVGIVDRNPNKLNSYLHGVKVIGLDVEIPKIISNYEIDEVVIAIPSLVGEDYERLLRLCKEQNVDTRVMPYYEDVISGSVKVNNLREIEIADLLGRKEVVLDQNSIAKVLNGKTVLVTGAGGSIGSEICRQVAKFHPEKLLLLGHGENSIYLIHQELTNLYNDIEIIPVIADIQDRKRIDKIMAEYRPHTVYHAAAHKHVPLMEYNPSEAVKNNIYGTRNVAEAAKEFGVVNFVMISTDKAVNPPNVMGATKRVAEMIVTSLNEPNKTRFSAVRFGNVLGSRGSVVPLFKKQLAKGGPLTVTDFRMTRYFMTIPEASRLVIQASSLMKGGEIFVLDMGESVRIVDLAKKMITLSGFNENDIKIIESGIRPGEKLYEELLSSKENTEEQIYDKIFVGKVISKPGSEVNEFIDSLKNMDAIDLKKSLVEFARQEN